MHKNKLLILYLFAGIISQITKLKMEELKIAFNSDILTENSISCFKVICSKCAGSGNFKTPENSRRTCLECFGKGFINV